MRGKGMPGVEFLWYKGMAKVSARVWGVRRGHTHTLILAHSNTHTHSSTRTHTHTHTHSWGTSTRTHTHTHSYSHTPTHTHTLLGDFHTGTHIHTHTGTSTQGQVGERLTVVLVVLVCNAERKHCSAHSLPGWANGSGERAGDQWSKCQRTIPGGVSITHTHTVTYKHTHIPYTYTPSVCTKVGYTHLRLRG